MKSSCYYCYISTLIITINIAIVLQLLSPLLLLYYYCYCYHFYCYVITITITIIISCLQNQSPAQVTPGLRSSCKPTLGGPSEAEGLAHASPVRFITHPSEYRSLTPRLLDPAP